MVYTLVKSTKITFIKNIDILCRYYYCTEIAQVWNTQKYRKTSVWVVRKNDCKNGSLLIIDYGFD